MGKILPRSILRHCHAVLVKSDKFATREDLRTLFDARELSDCTNFDDIIEANTPPKRVDQAITYLLGQGVCNGKLVFLIFLETLHDPFSKDGLNTEIEECIIEVEIDSVMETIRGLDCYLSTENIKELLKLFLACPSIQEREQRTRVLQKLQRASITLDPLEKMQESSTREDVLQILLTCSKSSDDLEQLSDALYQVLGGATPEWQAFNRVLYELLPVNVTYTRRQQLYAILDMMDLPEKSELIDMYTACGGDIADVPDDNLRSLPDRLAGARDSTALLKFVEHLASYAKKQQLDDFPQKLRNWNKTVATELGISAGSLEKIGEDVRNYYISNEARYLLITIKSLVSSQEEKKFAVRAWLKDSNNKTIRNTSPYPPLQDSSEGKIVTLDHIYQCINEIKAQYACYLSKQVEIEVFLTKDLLCYEIDHCPIEFGPVWGDQKAELGIQHKLVVRSFERAYSPSMRTSWQEKWELYLRLISGREVPNEALFPQDPVWLCSQLDCEAQNFYATLYLAKIVCPIPNFMLPSPLPDRIAGSMLNAGMPIALWIREHPGSVEERLGRLFADIRSNIEEDCSAFLKGLPDWVWHQRFLAIGDTAHPGQHLTLLRDDPSRLPPPLAARLFGSERRTS